jgi:hypothetical protein
MCAVRDDVVIVGYVSAQLCDMKHWMCFRGGR